MAKIKDMQMDPEPLDLNDPEVIQEMFEQYASHGLKPKDLPNMKPELKVKYAEWLESPRG